MNHYLTQYKIKLFLGDISENSRFLNNTISDFQPEAIIHYAEQPSAPFSTRIVENSFFPLLFPVTVCKVTPLVIAVLPFVINVFEPFIFS